jgi:DNA topoisomerase-1
MSVFAKVLPDIRAGVAVDMARRGLPREKVLATIVSLLESTLIRVGNEDYARQNGSFGISTLRDRHTQIDGAEVTFKFIGKSGKPWRVTLRDRRVAKIVKACQDLPGQRLFQYLDEDGKVQRITSTDVNAYLRNLAGADVTAKDFRTWSGTVMTALVLKEVGKATSATMAKKAIRMAIQEVAARLGNTPTICRKCYIHPAVFAHHLAGNVLRISPTASADAPSLSTEERAVLRLITANKGEKAQIAA